MDKGEHFCPALQSPGWVGALLPMCMATITWGCQADLPPPDRGCLFGGDRTCSPWSSCSPLMQEVWLAVLTLWQWAVCFLKVSSILTLSSATFAAVPTVRPGMQKPCAVLRLLVWWPVRHSLGIPWPMHNLTRPARCQACLGNLISPSPFWSNTT